MILVLMRIGQTIDAPDVIGKRITWGDAFAVQSRLDISQNEPTMIIDGYTGTLADNYCEIIVDEQPPRCYYITEVERLTGNRTQLHLDVDVWETYKSKISQLTIVADRATSHNNRYVADGLQLTSSKPQVIFKVFAGQPFNSAALTSNSRCIVVRGAIKTGE